MKLSWGQWLSLAFGGIAWMNKHADAVDDAVKLWRSVVPDSDQVGVGGAMTHTDALNKIRSGDLSPEEKAQMDRASQSWG